MSQEELASEVQREGDLETETRQEKSAGTGIFGGVRMQNVVGGITAPTVSQTRTEKVRRDAPASQNRLRLSTGTREINGSLPSDSVNQPVYVSRFSEIALSRGLLCEPEEPPYDPSPFSFLPRYLRGYGWSPTSNCESITIKRTFTDSPLPRPPAHESANFEAISTIRNYPALFNVSTPIRFDKLKEMCRDHPRQDFVDSVVTTLQEGAWPWANTHYDDGFPLTWDNAWRLPKDEKEQDFVSQYAREEFELGHYSQDFGPDLLPGMYATPVFAIPKPHSDNLRLVNHLSAGKYAQNLMMDRSETCGARLDTLHNFMAALLKHKKENPSKKLIVWKSDVKGAFRLIPVHPLWQIKQITTTNIPTQEQIDKGVDIGPLHRHVDWRCCFGSCGSPRCFSSFMGLVCWIAAFVILILALFTYADDNWSWDDYGNTLYYEPYKKHMPRKQVMLLKLWDELGIPHEERKQVSGLVLTIIGFSVDPNLMTVTMPQQARVSLLEHVEEFVRTISRRRPLQEWAQLAGYISWSLNVFPLLRPALSNVYAKLSNKKSRRADIYLNKAVVADLN